MERHLDLDLFGEDCSLATRLPGLFNVSNIMAAVTVAYREGCDVETIEMAVPEFPGVPGRYQELQMGQPFRIMVDFAHNPDALAKILEMAGEEGSGRRILVFGCEGEKDRVKRPIMGRIAFKNSEIPILTSDNLYHEDLNHIVDDVLQTLDASERSKMIVEPDRRKAIEKAIGMARPGDFIIVAGKGHEEYLVSGNQQIHFNDAEVIQEILGERNPS
jgi:UDP-N-acetylmuramyl-tripeptide synthetase